MSDFPELITERLILRGLRESDFDQLILTLNNENVTKQVFTIPFPFTLEHAKKRLKLIHDSYAKKERFIFSIAWKETDQVIGQIGLHPNKEHNHAELGYVLAEPFWGRGLMTEAIETILPYGFEVCKFHKIYATHYVDNPASGKCLIKAGLKLEGELKEHYKTPYGYKTVKQFGLTINDFKTGA